MRTCIIGPGALGSLLAATLWPVRENNTLVLLDHRPGRAARLDAEGLVFRKNGDDTIIPVPVTAETGIITGCDVLLLCVKAGDVALLLERLSPLLSPDTLVIGMENGISHLRPLQLLPCPVAAGVTTAGATLLRPGLVRFGGSGQTWIGALDQAARDDTRLDLLVEWLNRAGMATALVDDIQTRIWNKLFVNVGINALTALTGRTNGQLLTSCALRHTMKQAITEAVAVARARKIPIQGDPIQATLTVCRRTRNNVSSMLQDIRMKKRTEIDAMNGAIVREGALAGIPTPVNKKLVQQIRALESSWEQML